MTTGGTRKSFRKENDVTQVHALKEVSARGLKGSLESRRPDRQLRSSLEESQAGALGLQRGGRVGGKSIKFSNSAIDRVGETPA